MCNKRFLGISIVTLLCAAMWSIPPAAAEVPVGTAVTYQGELEEAGSAVDDTCDFEFSLWDDPATPPGMQVGPTLSQTIVVADGRFTTSLDFGGDIFTGGRALWLEIAVCCPSTCTVTTLSPRQELTPAPHALALPGLWTQQNAVSPNMIGGYSSNSVDAGVFGATISGGGAFASTHLVTDNFGTVGGGVDNQAGNDDGDVGNAAYATVGGGQFHEASGQQSTIGGGWFNEASDDITTVGGGGGNVASARAATVGGGWLNEVAAEYGTVAGGGARDPADDATRNRVFDEYGAIGGGGDNQAGSDDGNATSAMYSTVGGGRSNTASGRLSTLGGGDENVASGEKSTIGGGASNTASLDGATVGGGLGNTAGNFNATVAGGNSNQATGDGATVGGGAGNIAGGFRSTVSGGLSNAAGGDYSFAAGRRAKANHAGTFVWGDSTDADFSSTAANTFLIRASGGVGIGTTTPSQRLSVFDGELALQVADNVNEQSILFQNSGGNYVWRLYRSDAGNSDANLHFAGGQDTSDFTLLPDRLTIDAAGEVGIGTSNPGFLLEVNGTAGKPGGGSWSNSSDRHLKKHIHDLNGALDKLEALRGVTFEYKNPEGINELAGRRIGMIAQEVEEVFPDWVAINGRGHKTVTYRGFEALTVEALRELREEKDAEIAALRAEMDDRIAALEKKLVELAAQTER